MKNAEGVKRGEIEKAIDKALGFYLTTQREDGSLTGDYGGALFLTPLYVCVAYIVGHKMDEKTQLGIKRYLLAMQRLDGSFGLHIEGEGTVFVTSLAYVALRLLGMKAEEPQLRKALSWLEEKGGPTGSAPWGKFALALMGLYSYEGLNPILPELWLLPSFSPFHPGKMWCHARVVYLPMAYLYSRRVTCLQTPLLAKIREELYGGSYDTIDWKGARHRTSPTDVYRACGLPLRIISEAMALFEQIRPARLREKGLEVVLDHIRHEDDTTDFIDIGPVNKLLNTVCEWSVDPNSERFRKAVAKLPGYLWTDENGWIKMNGYNSLQLWDTAFTAQAVAATSLWPKYALNLRGMYQFIRDNQIVSDVDHREKYYRDPSRGGWPFSNRPHGWPISDCTAEGFKAATLLASLRLPSGKPLLQREELIDDDMLKAAVDLILFFQNDDGGWATYEKRRCGSWVEVLNPSLIFGDIMTDYSYVECTSACIQALVVSLDVFKGWKEAEIRRAIARGRDFLLARQRPDGSWEGSWGVCFTYGTWFATWGLRAAGIPPWHDALKRGARFLIGKQNTDGGWGEHYTSCPTRRYVPHPRSQPVMTSWATLALMAVGGYYHPRGPLTAVAKKGKKHNEAEESLLRSSIEAAVAFLLRSQLPNGDWQQEAIAGVFNKTCMITYDNYRRYFPIWVLGLYKDYLERSCLEP